MGQVQLGPVTHLTPAEVQQLWIDNGGDPSKALTAAAIVFSSENPAGNAGLVNDTPSTSDYSVGLFQINYYGSLEVTQTARFGDPASLAADPNLQARAAIAMSSNGANWQPWGPDFGYPDYSKPVSDPLPGSRVANWLAKNGGASPIALQLPQIVKPLLVAGSLLVLASLVSEAIRPGSSPLSPKGRRALGFA